MCVHCGGMDMMAFQHRNQQEHDMWLFPHGRYGYNVNTDEDKRRHAEAIMNCPYCPAASKEWARAANQSPAG